MDGHAGTCRHFLVFEADADSAPREVERLDLPKQLTIREFSGDGPHPLDAVRAVIVSRAGPGVIDRMSARKVDVVTTSERDPIAAVVKYLAGKRPPGAHAAGPEHVTDSAIEFLKAMASKTRLQILCALSPGEKRVSELERELERSQSLISQELSRLRRVGLVACRHDGSSVYYRLANQHVSKVIRAVHEAHCDKRD